MTLDFIPASADAALIARLIGLPHRDGAEGPDAYDCWNLFAHVQREMFGREVPWSDSFLPPARSPREVLEALRWSELRRMWPEVARPRHGDAVLMARTREVRHIGVWIDLGPGLCGCLHATTGPGVVLETLAQLRVNFPTIGFARCADRTLAVLAATDRTFLPHCVSAPVAILVADILNPLADAEIVPLRPGDAVSRALDFHPDPDSRWIILNDTPLLRRHPETGLSEFDRPVAQGDVVWVLPPLPLRGGGSQVLAALLSVLVSIAAPWAATTLGFIHGTLTHRLVTAGIAIAAQALISSLIPTPPPPAQLANPEPTYSFGRFGNRLRPGATIPRPFGTMHREPDLLSPPWAEFEDNDQLVHILLCLGDGEHQLLEFGIDDTAVWLADTGYTGAIGDLAHEVLLPGEAPTLFPTAIDVSPEVDGLELPEPDAVTGEIVIGPFAAVASGRTANELIFDFAFPRGLFEFENGERNTTVTWRINAQLIDDLGQVVGFPQVLDTVSLTKATTTPQRLTRRYAVEEGRYQVWVARTSASTLTGTGAQDQLVWAGLKAKRTDVESYPHVTALALRVRAGATSQSGLSNWYAITRAILPHFDMATGDLVTGPTEQIAAAVLQIARDPETGLGLPDSQIDFEALWSIQQVWHARGDVCCTALEGELTGWEALTTVLGAGRTRPSFVGSTLTFVRDGPRLAPTRLITQADIVRGSFVVERVHFLRDSPLAVTMIYRDRRGRMRSMLIPPDADESRAAEFRTQVHVDPEHVWRDGNFMVAETLLRRRFCSFVALPGASAFLPGELVQLAHPRPKYGAGGRVVALEGLTMEVAFRHGLAQAEPGWLSLGRPDGSWYGELRCYGVDEHRIQIDANDLETVINQPSRGAYSSDFRDWLITEATGGRASGTIALNGRQADPTTAAVGREGQRKLAALIVEVLPAEDGLVEVLAVEHAPAVHEADLAPMPALTDLPPALRNDARPAWEGVQIAGTVNVGVTPNVADFNITGPAIPGAVRYFAEVSAGDSPADWQPVAEAATPVIAGPAGVPNGRYIRVAAAGPVLRGPWRVYLVNFGNASGGVTVAEFQYQED